MSSLEEEARQQRQALSKAETEKRQLQEKHTDLEKVGRRIGSRHRLISLSL